MRPIVSGINSLNEGLCSWVDSLLQPLIKHTPGYLKVSKHVLSVLDNLTWNSEYAWISADVKALYTVIPHDLALVALDWFLDNYSNYSVDLKMFISMVVHFLLKHNFFVFCETFYLQVTGPGPWGLNSPRHLQIFL